MYPNSGNRFLPPQGPLLPLPESECAASTTQRRPPRRATPHRPQCRFPYRSWPHRSVLLPPLSQAANPLSLFLFPNLPRARVSGRLASSVARRTGMVSVLTCPRRRLSCAPRPCALSRNTPPRRSQPRGGPRGGPRHSRPHRRPLTRLRNSTTASPLHRKNLHSQRIPDTRPRQRKHGARRPATPCLLGRRLATVRRGRRIRLPLTLPHLHAAGAEIVG